CENDDDSQPSRAEAAVWWFHATNYKDFRVADEGSCLNSHTPPTARVNRPVLVASSLVPTARAIQAYILSVAAAAGNPTPHKAPEAVPRSSFLFERVYSRAVFDRASAVLRTQIALTMRASFFIRSRVEATPGRVAN